MNCRDFERRKASDIDVVPDACHTEGWNIVVGQPGKRAGDFKNMHVSECESQQRSSLSQAFVPSQLRQACIEDIERMPIRTEFLPNFIYAISQGLVTAQAFFQHNADEQQAFVDGGSQLIDAGNLMFRLRPRGGFYLDMNSLPDEIVAFTFRAAPLNRTGFGGG